METLTDQQKRRQAGFTLIEMITVTAIIALLAIVAVANFRGAEGRSNLKHEAEDIAGSLREAENYAISQKRISDPENQEDTIVPDGGYGVYFNIKTNPKGYIIFADTGDSSDGYYSADDEVLLKETLLPGVSFEEIKLNGGSSSSLSLSVIYEPPNGAVTFNTVEGHGGQPDVADAILVISHEDENDYKYITVYKATGGVEIE